MKVHKEKLGILASGVVAYAKEHTQKIHATTLSLGGDLGAGKTTLVQHVAQVLGVTETVPSPTFVIMRSYKTADPVFTRLVHIDAYRIEEERELTPLHLDALFADPHTLVCIEWPEKLGSALPQDALRIELHSAGELERDVSVNPDIEPYVAGAC